MTLDLDRGTGANTGNIVQFNSLSVNVASPPVPTGRVDATVLVSSGAGNYKATFTGPTVITGDTDLNPSGQANFNVQVQELVLQGAISGNFPMTKLGSGKLTLNSVGTNTSTTTVSAGTLAGNGGVGGSLNVALGGTFAPGNTVVGTPSPGNGMGIFSVANNLTLNTPFSSLVLELSHGVGPTPVPGIDYDQVMVGTGGANSSTGTVGLGGSRLTLTIGTGVQGGDLFFIIVNDGPAVSGDLITTRFNGLATDGMTFTPAGSSMQFKISYNADSVGGTFTGGNDVALQAVPEPTTGVLAISAGAALLGLRRRRRS